MKYTLYAIVCLLVGCTANVTETSHDSTVVSGNVRCQVPSGTYSVVGTRVSGTCRESVNELREHAQYPLAGSHICHTSIEISDDCNTVHTIVDCPKIHVDSVVHWPTGYDSGFDKGAGIESIRVIEDGKITCESSYNMSYTWSETSMVRGN